MLEAVKMTCIEELRDDLKQDIKKILFDELKISPLEALEGYTSNIDRRKINKKQNNDTTNQFNQLSIDLSEVNKATPESKLVQQSVLYS